MSNKAFTLILIAIVMAFFALTFVFNQAKGPSSQLLDSQQDTVRILSRLEEKMESGDGQGIAAVLTSVSDLQRRVAALEAKLQGAGAPQKGAPQRPPAEDYSKVHDLAVAHSPVLGNKTAKATIVEFVDFQCPFCARFHPMINKVMEAYPDDVKYMVKNFPLSFHPEGRPAAKAAFAAGEQGKYWEMVELILGDNSNLSSDRYKELAEKIGLDVEKFLSDIKDKNDQWEAWIDADIQLGVKSEVRGTPTFFLNGKKTRARDFNSLKAEIDSILSGK